jgi:hypothetical protein
MTGAASAPSDEAATVPGTRRRFHAVEVSVEVIAAPNGSRHTMSTEVYRVRS